ncbi:dihydrolipoamide dehydrogenase [Ruminiclostridium sufflavum DSM 19573]|uniref:Dihydrolipoyl dehydrogenase n=1 Tax=Ruminiclostridium sufflavum DSM 19573 TaxID=1121337 RepID=A0A318XHX1_9FIRM|nr:dihydrolipoyl dehydrogenase [Ruminiclostridium sufflavum]PYG84953.1 dihydrolipoamide dehydrogenase [Ruminiclostridium sufflavum DSM 19573]
MVYDLIILGGGSAGYRAALTFAKQSKGNVLLIEQSELGGVCLNEGCIPTKLLLHSAKVYEAAKKGESLGVVCETLTYNSNQVMNLKANMIGKLKKGINYELKQKNVEVKQGKAHLLKEGNQVYVEIGCLRERYEAKNVLIATGAKPVIPHIQGIERGIAERFVLTSKEILELKDIPDKLVIIGGGVIGLEMATYFSTFGCKVSIVEATPKILGNADNEITRIMLNFYRRRGIEFYLNTKVTTIEEERVLIEEQGNQMQLMADRVLLTVGRRACIDDLGLDEVGIVTEEGFIVVNADGRTNIPGIYAAGDVIGGTMLAHAASKEADICINTILNKAQIKTSANIPSIIYGMPEVAYVGETEESARNKGIDYEVAKLPLGYNGRYMIENGKDDAICKLIISKVNQTLIGVHIIGNSSSEMIYGMAYLINQHVSIHEIKEMIFPHPTVSEIIGEASQLFDV